MKRQAANAKTQQLAMKNINSFFRRLKSVPVSCDAYTKKYGGKKKYGGVNNKHVKTFKDLEAELDMLECRLKAALTLNSPPGKEWPLAQELTEMIAAHLDNRDLASFASASRDIHQQMKVAKLEPPNKRTFVDMVTPLIIEVARHVFELYEREIREKCEERRKGNKARYEFHDLAEWFCKVPRNYEGDPWLFYVTYGVELVGVSDNPVKRITLMLGYRVGDDIKPYEVFKVVYRPDDAENMRHEIKELLNNIPDYISDVTDFKKLQFSPWLLLSASSVALNAGSKRIIRDTHILKIFHKTLNKIYTTATRYIMLRENQDIDIAGRTVLVMNMVRTDEDAAAENVSDVEDDEELYRGPGWDTEDAEEYERWIHNGESEEDDDNDSWWVKSEDVEKSTSVSSVDMTNSGSEANSGEKAMSIGGMKKTKVARNYENRTMADLRQRAKELGVKSGGRTKADLIVALRQKRTVKYR